MSIGFIVDASTDIGSGHWSRCLNFTKIIGDRNNYFISRFFFKNKKKISKIKIIKIKKDQFNIKELRNVIENYNIKTLVIDNYSFNYLLQKKINKYVKKLIIISDFKDKKYYCDVLLNYSFLNKAEKNSIKKKNPNIQLALGPKYLALNKKFFELKKKAKSREKIKKIMIFFGGSDKLNLTEKILLIPKLFKKIQFLIVIGDLNSNKKKITEISKKYKNINLFCGVTNEKMAKIVNQSDLAIGAGGVNLSERSYLGLPSIVISASKNQLLNIKNFEKKGMIINLGINNSYTNDKVVDSISFLIKNNNKFKKFSINCLNSLKENHNNNHLKRLFSL